MSHPVLGPRLAEITEAVSASGTTTALLLMGQPDDMKLHACMTLFTRADPNQEVFNFQAVLDKVLQGCSASRDRQHFETTQHSSWTELVVTGAEVGLPHDSGKTDT